jgi:uncharacterized protein (TIGR00369 family)
MVRAIDVSAMVTDREPAGLPDGAAGLLQEYIDSHHEFLSWLGVTVEAFEQGSTVMTLAHQPKLTNKPPDGTSTGGPNPIQGGVASTLVDVAGGMALRPYLADPLRDSLATINLNINYLRPATGDLRAEATVIRAGASVGVSAVLVTAVSADGTERDIVHGTGSFRLFGDVPSP